MNLTVSPGAADSGSQYPTMSLGNDSSPQLFECRS